jgi:hypothetical protein
MTHQIPEKELADLVSKATEMAKSDKLYARIISHNKRYKAGRVDLMCGTDIYVVFPDGTYEAWDNDKSAKYRARAKAIIRKMTKKHQS